MESLTRHIMSAHGFDVSVYRKRYGADAPVRALGARTALVEGVKKSHRERGTGKGERKTVMCPSCNIPHEMSKFVVPGVHDLRCDACKATALKDLWDGKTEGYHFVVCRLCSHRAENLTSHIRQRHPEIAACYRETYGNSSVVASCSAVRDKSKMRGRSLSDKTRKLMSERAGRWNKGLTKGTDFRVLASALSMKGRPSWNRGLARDTDARVAASADKLRAYVGEARPWSNGLALGLLPVDFEPFLDEQGCVDRRAVETVVGASWPTIYSYMQEHGLKTSNKYVKARSEAAIIRLDRESFEPYMSKRGIVYLGRAMAGLGHGFSVIKRECQRNGLETYGKRVRQGLCLQAVSEALGSASFNEEWMSRRYVNPVSGAMFKFDGYYPAHDLIVEFHGYQHYVFPNVFFPDETYRPLWEAMLERDRVKQKMIEDSGTLHYLCVREDEPYTDLDFLRGRLGTLLVGCSPDVECSLSR